MFKMMASTYSLPWGSTTTSSPKSTATNTRSNNDSAFQDEHEYSNPGGAGHEYSNPESSYESGYNPSSTEPEYSNTSGASSDSCPDYEEVTDDGRRIKGLVYNLASEGIFHSPQSRGGGGGGDLHLDSSDPVTKEKIMSSLIYCIHKVGRRSKVQPLGLEPTVP